MKAMIQKYKNPAIAFVLALVLVFVTIGTMPGHEANAAATDITNTFAGGCMLI